MLNKQRGNMYPWVTHTWNPIKGRCGHQCVYCYMNGRSVGGLRLDEKCLSDNLGEGRTIFVGSSTDMWCSTVWYGWIYRVLDRCCGYSRNRYLFQSKNPLELWVWQDSLPKQSIVGTTLETNRDSSRFSKAPCPGDRARWLSKIEHHRKMVSVEPVMDFDLDLFLEMIVRIKPEFVSLGADSKGHGLPEPSGDKLRQLARELGQFTEVKAKKNLERLLR